MPYTIEAHLVETAKRGFVHTVASGPTAASSQGNPGQRPLLRKWNSQELNLLSKSLHGQPWKITSPSSLGTLPSIPLSLVLFANLVQKSKNAKHTHGVGARGGGGGGEREGREIVTSEANRPTLFPEPLSSYSLAV